MVFARTRCVLISSAFSVWITPGIVVTMVEAGTAGGVPAGGTAVVVAGADGAVVAPGAGTSVESGAGVTLIAGGAGTTAVLGASTAVADAGEGVAAATGGGVDVGVVADAGDDIGATVVEGGAYTTGGAGVTVSTLETSCAWGVVLVHPAESAKAIVRPQIAYRPISLSSLSPAPRPARRYNLPARTGSGDWLRHIAERALSAKPRGMPTRIAIPLC